MLGVVRPGLVILSLGWLAGWWLLARVPRLSPPPRSGAGPVGRGDGVSVVIPARNEAENLPHLLGSLARQDLVPEQVIVVDDGSTDDTAAVARAHGALVVESATLPEGWTGKSWACMQGTDVA